MILDLYSLPVEELIWLKREELTHEFESIRLLREASLSNPGLIERAYIQLGKFLVKTGQHLNDQYTSSRQTYLITSSKIAA